MSRCEALNEELAARLSAGGDNKAFSLLFLHYLPKIRQIAKRYYPFYADYEDIVQEGVIGLYKAALVYKPEKNVPFSAFALLCIKRQIINASQKYTRYPEILSDFSDDNIDVGGKYRDLLYASYTDPEDFIVGREDFETVKEFIKERLSGFEYNVLRHYLTGIKYSEIARIMNKPQKSIDNAISRIKQKLFRSIKDS